MMWRLGGDRSARQCIAEPSDRVAPGKRKPGGHQKDGEPRHCGARRRCGAWRQPIAGGDPPSYRGACCRQCLGVNGVHHPTAALAGSLGLSSQARPLSNLQARVPNGRCWPKGERRLSAVGMPERTFTFALPNGGTRPMAAFRLQVGLWPHPNGSKAADRVSLLHRRRFHRL
jgi:hypothetical protein